MRLTRLALAAITVFFPVEAIAQRAVTPAADPIILLARVWGEAKYFHPALAEPWIAWDSVGAAAIGTFDERRSEPSGALLAAVNSMLSALRDPVTRVISISSSAAKAPPPSSTPARFASAVWGPDSVLTLDIGSVFAGPRSRSDSALRALYRLSDVVSRARHVVVDLRGGAGMPAGFLASLLARTTIDASLLDRGICGVAERRRMYVGFPEANIVPPSAGWRELDAPCFRAASRVAKDDVVFVMDSATPIPPIVPAMYAAKLASIRTPGALSDEALVALDTIPIAPGVAVQLRLGALARCFGWCASDGGLRAAPTRVVPDTGVPTRARRILAAFEIYNNVRLFDPNVHLIEGHNWDSVFAANVPSIATAASRRAYVETISAFVAALNDGHAILPASRLFELFGYAAPPFDVRRVEGRLVVAKIFDSAAAPRVRRGDIVYSVDGVDAVGRAAEIRRYVPGSNAVSRDERAVAFVTVGRDSSIATVVLGDAHGPRDTVRVVRGAAAMSDVLNPTFGPAMRLLPSGIGYVDLSRLSPSNVDSMFTRFASTKALIFDVRAYPRGAGIAVASRIARDDVVIFRGQTPVVDGPERAGLYASSVVTQMTRLSSNVTQRVVPDGRAPYRGRVYVLMDDRSMSQAEQTALILRTAAGAILVGTNTAGADGPAVSFTIPGGVGVTFTGSIAMTADGVPIQGPGLTPDVRVSPTIAGLRAGRDELLDCAVALASSATGVSSRSCAASRSERKR
jgi:C-terminal processing protease CtpA/Prc